MNDEKNNIKSPGDEKSAGFYGIKSDLVNVSTY